MTSPSPTNPRTPAECLRALIAEQGCIPMPGSFNALCARAVAQAGFTATYVSGAATSVCAGVPDVGLLTVEHFCRVIREIHLATGLPVLADADTGFGEAEMVRRTVIDYHAAGAAGLHIEDQAFPKRCGHLDGKALISTEHMVEKITWAAKAARDLAWGYPNPPAIIICARTDARGVEGLDAAIDRAHAYCQAGAEMIFPEGLTTLDEFATFATRLKARAPGVLLLANMTEFGKTPITPLSQFKQIGYHVVIYPVSLLRVAMGAVAAALAELQSAGSVQPFLGKMQTRQELYDLIGYTPGTPWELPAR
ncbi:MAG: oxaloacetate decarboxylase [bacterium]